MENKDVNNAADFDHSLTVPCLAAHCHLGGCTMRRQRVMVTRIFKG